MEEEKTEVTEEATEETAEEMFPAVPETEPEDKIAPYRAAAAQRKENAAVIEEHDGILAELLYEMTMQELEN